MKDLKEKARSNETNWSGNAMVHVIDLKDLSKRLAAEQEWDTALRHIYNEGVIGIINWLN